MNVREHFPTTIPSFARRSWAGPRVGGLLALLALLVSVGCASGGKSDGSAPDELHLFAVPTAIPVGDRPVADGIGVRIYASPAGKAQGIPIRTGRLEVVMFDGTPTPSTIRTATPLHVWSFTAGELIPFVATTSLGTGYQLALGWGISPPSRKVVTVIARYHPNRGSDLISTANTISVRSR